ncbi:restriction endonuclease-related protein [Streptomyces acidiscabies]|uniref:pPIWI_RE_Y domain-containing protein n=1 Tax=Streptomyces acidiscabies TaxID=42234 RepID=UPI0009535518|nr:HU-CCDC81 and SPOR domain-containing protein [Streptomyces acidiscabies]
MTAHDPDTVSLPAADWAAHDGIPLLRTLAGGLIALEAATGLDSFTLPYPPEAQRALDRVVLACLLNGEQPPAGLIDLVGRCTQPLVTLPLGLPPDVVGPQDRLLDEESGRPTDLCHEWAWRTPDAAVEFRDRQVVRAALRLCREYGDEEAYTAFRGLLVHRPVLTQFEMLGLDGDMVFEPVRNLIRQIYRPVPDSYLQDGFYTCCDRCRTLLLPTRDGDWWCERDRCRQQGPAPAGLRIPRETSGEVCQLERPLRQFVTGPGRAEADLERDLTALGLDVRMWPGYDAYDLLVEFPDGHRWAIDVKDWAHPVLLGRSARPVPYDPPYDEAFWCVPVHRTRARHDYVAAFERARPTRAGHLPLLTDHELVSRARTRLGTLEGGTGHA